MESDIKAIIEKGFVAFFKDIKDAANILVPIFYADKLYESCPSCSIINMK